MKTKEIELFGEKVLLSELTAEDFFVLKAFSEKNRTPAGMIQANYLCVEMSLSRNVRPLPAWWHRKERRQVKGWNRKFSGKHIRANVGLCESGELFEQIFALSGLTMPDDKKKLESEVRSAEKSQEELSVTS